MGTTLLLYAQEGYFVSIKRMNTAKFNWMKRIFKDDPIHLGIIEAGERSGYRPCCVLWYALNIEPLLDQLINPDARDADDYDLDPHEMNDAQLAIAEMQCAVWALHATVKNKQPHARCPACVLNEVFPEMGRCHRCLGQD